MIEKNCATCKDGYMTDKPGGRSVVFCRPCFEKTGLPLWSEHELITMGRRAGIEEAAQIANEMHRSGEYCFTCTAEYEVKIRALLEAKT